MRRNRPIYYGWFITLALAITETISYGIMFYAFSVFITPMEADLGWSRGALTGGFSLALLVTGLLAFPVGWWVDKHGARLLMTTGSIIAALLIVAWSQVTTLTGFYLIWFGLGVCAAMVWYEPAFAVIATWFTRRRSVALTIVTFTAGLASTIFLPLSDALLQSFGWRGAVLRLGIALGLITIPLHGLILRRHPHDLGYLPDGAARSISNPPSEASALPTTAALKSRIFWILTVTFTLVSFIDATLRVHFVPYLIDVGVTSTTAASASGMIGITQVVGRLAFAPIEARVTRYVVLIGLFTMQLAAIGFLLIGASLWTIGAFLILFGTAAGMCTLIRPSMLADLFGAASYGRISSVMTLPLRLSATIAPVFAGGMFDYFGSYHAVLWIILALAGLVLLITLVAFPVGVHDSVVGSN